MNDLHLAVSLNSSNYRLGFEVPKPGTIKTPREEILAYAAQIAASRGVTVDDIMGRSQRRKPAHARFELFAYIRSQYRWSMPRIGRFVGGRDHTTVLNGLRRHAKLNAAA